MSLKSPINQKVRIMVRPIIKIDKTKISQKLPKNYRIKSIKKINKKVKSLTLTKKKKK